MQQFKHLLTVAFYMNPVPYLQLGTSGIKCAVIFYKYPITRISRVPLLPKDDLGRPGKGSLPYCGVQWKSNRVLQGHITAVYKEVVRNVMTS